VSLRLDPRATGRAAAAGLRKKQTPPVVGTDGAYNRTTTETKMETREKDFNPQGGDELPTCEVCGEPESDCLCADDPRFTFPARLERMADQTEEMFI
jgi:hypothetical protein